MKLRYPAIAVVGSSLILGLVLSFQSNWRTAPVPEAVTEVSNWQPALLRQPEEPHQSLADVLGANTAAERPVLSLESPAPPVLDVALLEMSPPVETWSGALSAGETLDALLSN